MTADVIPRRPRRETKSDDRLRAVLELHFHPDRGSRYWLGRQARLGWDVLDRVRTAEDLWLLGPMQIADLRRFPVRDFVPQTFHRNLHRFVVGETAGTSGEPRATAYRADEFRAGFVTPFLRVARATGFPRRVPWLWVGPSGPHVIGKAVRELARRTGSMDPFSVDFDPRWAKRLADGSVARQRYLDHVTEQAIDVIAREDIGVLFSTPPALAALVRRMTDRQREAIHGVHYGGLPMTADTVNEFRAAFPNAVHLAGYGNTLFGVVMEVADKPRLALDYFPLGDRVRFHVVAPLDEAAADWPPRQLEPGQRGRIVFDRLDESCLLVGVVERDEAELTRPSPEAVALGGTAFGLRDPRPPAALTGQLQLGLY
jgi:thienamycin biosynthesis protein ThnN